MPRAPHINPLTHATLPRAAKALAAADPDLATMLHADGLPPLWAKRPGFASLVYIILGQQVSLASADAAYRRLSAGVGRITPRLVLAHSHRQLMRLGQTRQKARYCRELAVAIVNGSLDLKSLALAPNEHVERELTAITGIGRWTSDIYLLMALRRADLWPRGDLALYQEIRTTIGIDGPPEKLDAYAERWKPWRSVAARMLWHHYLRQKRSTRR